MQGSILQRVASGDQMAVQECLDRFGGLVWSLARRFCYNLADAEDAVQEIFLDLWRSSARYDPNVATEATFVAMIARRRLIDRGRKAQREVDKARLAHEIEHIEVSPTRAAEVTEEAAMAARALEGLKPEQQRVLRLSIYQGLSHEKIAETTGLPLGTVKTHVRRGLIRIREALAAREDPRDGANGDSSTGSGVDKSALDKEAAS